MLEGMSDPSLDSIQPLAHDDGADESNDYSSVSGDAVFDLSQYTYLSLDRPDVYDYSRFILSDFHRFDFPESYFYFEIEVVPDDAPHRPQLVSVSEARRALCNPMYWAVQRWWPKRVPDRAMKRWEDYWSAFEMMRREDPTGGVPMLGWVPDPSDYVLRQRDAWESLSKRMQDLSFFMYGTNPREVKRGNRYVSEYDPWTVRLRRVNDFVSVAAAYVSAMRGIPADKNKMVQDATALMAALLPRLSKTWSRLSRPERVVVISRAEIHQLGNELRPKLSGSDSRRPRPEKAIAKRREKWLGVGPEHEERVEEALSILCFYEYIFAAKDAGAKEFVSWSPSVNESGMLFKKSIRLYSGANNDHGAQDFIWNNWRPYNRYERIETARRFLRGRKLEGTALWRMLTPYFRNQLESFLKTDAQYRADVASRGDKADPPLDWHNPVFELFTGKPLGHLPPGEHEFYVPASLMIPISSDTD